MQIQNNKLMYMSVLYEICIDYTYLNSKMRLTNTRISLYFTKPPSKEQVVEATRHYLMDTDASNETALAVMGEMSKLNKNIPVNDMFSTNRMSIYHSTTYLFEETNDD